MQVRYWPMACVFLEHPSSLEHDTGAHPERAARLIAIARALEVDDWLGFERIRSPAVDRAVLTAVHPEAYVDAIERAAIAGGRMLDADTVISPGSFEAALHAAGGAVRLVELLLDGEAECGFSAHRPPGHHATSTRAMGFCLFNNVAVAARHALDARGLDRVFVLDWDVHHGNGTSNIFYASDQVLFVSIHEWPLYPGTGAAGEAGAGEGRGFNVNLPVPAGSGDEDYGSLVEHVVAPLLSAYRPQLVLISAGYDAHRDDPLADCVVTEDGFAAMTRSMRRACDALGLPLGCVLEGGYALDALARSVVATMEVLRVPGAELGEDDVTVTRLAAQARGRLADYWPELVG
jgi:acetoin utilization deacetylase AcuC-like enzyme